MADIIARGMANGASELAQEALTKIAQLPDGLNYKGAVNNVSDLPTGAKPGDCYTVVNDHNNEYAWGKKDGVNQWIILGPEMANVAYTGNYNDLTNKPTIPTYSAGDGIVIDDGEITYDPDTLSTVDYVDGCISDTLLYVDQQDNSERLARVAGDNLKQDKLIAGEGITIADDGKTISATGGGASYTAGDNITIENNVISATDTTYTAGDNITIENGVISADNNVVYIAQLSNINQFKTVWDDIYGLNKATHYTKYHIYGNVASVANPNIVHFAQLLGATMNGINLFGLDNDGTLWRLKITKSSGTYSGAYTNMGQMALTSDLEGKQDVLTAGTNITIDENNVISASGGGSEYYSGDGIYIDEDNAINCDEQMIRDWQLQGGQDVNVMNDGGQMIFETIYGGGISREPGEQFHQFTARPSSFSDNKITYTQANNIENVYGACMYSGIINNPSTEEGIEFFGDNGVQRDGDWVHFSCGLFLDQPLSFWYNTQTQVNELRLDGDWQGYTSLGALQLKRIAIQTQPIQPDFIPVDNDTIQINDDGQLFANGGSQVSGTNDGTNWTSLTIDDDTYAIPAGGSGGGKDTRPLPQMLDIDLNLYNNFKIYRRNKGQPQSAFEFRTKADFLANIRIGGGFYRLNPYSGSSTTLTKQELSEALNATAGEWDSTIDIITYDLRYSNEGTRVSDSSYSLSKNSLVYFCQVTDANDTFNGSYMYSNPLHFVYMVVFTNANNNMGNAYIDAFNSMTSSKLNGDEFGGSLFSGWCYSVHDGLLDLARRYPLPPTADGNYVLKCSIVSGTPTYSWVAE